MYENQMVEGHGGEVLGGDCNRWAESQWGGWSGGSGGGHEKGQGPGYTLRVELSDLSMGWIWRVSERGVTGDAEHLSPGRVAIPLVEVGPLGAGPLGASGVWFWTL